MTASCTRCRTGFVRLDGARWWRCRCPGAVADFIFADKMAGAIDEAAYAPKVSPAGGCFFALPPGADLGDLWLAGAVVVDASGEPDAAIGDVP